MNKHVFKKIAELEKTELSEVKVELATIYDDLEGSIKQANQGVIKALELKSQAAKLTKESIDKNKELIKELNKVEPLIKQIGLDSELKKVQDAKNKVSSNIATIEKIYNSLLAI
jgi:hypothetical protein